MGLDARQALSFDVRVVIEILAGVGPFAIERGWSLSATRIEPGISPSRGGR
jgi:hypothetical protein